MTNVTQVQPLHRTAPGAPPPIQFPVLGGTVVTLQATGPVTEDAWEQMMGIFSALKPSFVSAPSRDEAPESDEGE